MSLRLLKWITILIPPTIIGGFEYIRHEFLESLSVQAGNLFLTLISFIISYLFATWMFKMIRRINTRLGEEQTNRAVFEERERMARDLHDNIAQILFFLNVSLKKGKVDEAKSAISEIDNHLRHAIFNLRSQPNEGFEFSNRINNWLEEWRELTGINVSQKVTVPKWYFSNKEEIQIFAIIQEAFTNIRKHSRATKASIEFSAANNGWELIIKDNGRGILNDTVNGNKYGLSIIKKRCVELSATFNIDNTEGGGLMLYLTGKGGNENGTIPNADRR